MSWLSLPNLVARLLVADAGGRRTILTSTFVPSDTALTASAATGGVSTHTWADDQTGWWARLEIQTPAPKARWRGTDGGDEDAASVAVRLVYSNGEEFSTVLSGLEGQVEVDKGLLQAISEARQTGGLANPIPASQARAILFLDGILDSFEKGPRLAESGGKGRRPLADSGSAARREVGVVHRPIVDVLSGLLEQSSRAEELRSSGAEVTWHLEVGKTRVGHVIDTPELLELLSEFRSVENVDPLSDLELDGYRPVLRAR